METGLDEPSLRKLKVRLNSEMLTSRVTAMGGRLHAKTTRVSVTRTTARLAGLASSGGGEKEESECPGHSTSPLLTQSSEARSCTVAVHAGNGVHTDFRDATTVQLMH